MATKFCDPALVSGANNGTSWEDAYRTLQAAIDAASAADEVWVKARTVVLGASIDFDNANTISLYGGFATSLSGTSGSVAGRNLVADVTLLDGAGTYTILNVSGNGTLDGITLHDGITSGGGSCGGISVNAAVTLAISKCKFDYNKGDYRGGDINIAAYNSTVTIEDCTFEGTTGAYYGGSIAAIGSGPTTIRRCVFSRCQAIYYGSAIRHSGSGTIAVEDCIVDRCLTTNATYGTGGAICFEGGAFTMTRTQVTKNSVTTGTVFGGGVRCNSSGSITNCVIAGNTGADYGGGICVSGTGVTVTMANCTIANNSANTGGAIRTRASGTLNIANCVVWGNGASPVSDGGTFAATYSDVQGGYTGTGNVDVDPKFRGAGPHPFDLGQVSNVVDSGNAGATYYPTTDILGRARVDYPGHTGTGAGSPAYSDMGAYELQYAPVYAPRKMWVNVAGTWKQVYIASSNVAGTWKPATKAETNVAGTWKYS